MDLTQQIKTYFRLIRQRFKFSPSYVVKLKKMFNSQIEIDRPEK